MLIINILTLLTIHFNCVKFIYYTKYAGIIHKLMMPRKGNDIYIYIYIPQSLT